MKTKAAILVETGQPLVQVELEIPALKAGQVLVEIIYSGICHTQLQEVWGLRGPDHFLPHCLGHEGSGVVVDVGNSVDRVKSGERVVLSWVKNSGREAGGTSYAWDGRTVNAGGVTTFQRHAVVSENRLSRIPDGVNLRDAVLLGCAVPTAFGAVLNTACPEPGQSLAVFGTGGVGLCAIAAAAFSECNPVIAVDLLEYKLNLAKNFGATHCVNATETNPVEVVAEICNGGLDFTIEACGQIEVVAQSLEVVRTFGGTCVVIGNPPHGSELILDPWQLIMGKRLVGAWSGSNDVERDFFRYGSLISNGQIKTNGLLSDPYPLSAIDSAIDDFAAGRVGRPLIDMAV